MPTVNYGLHGEPGFELVQDEELFVVRTRSQRSLRSRSTVAEPIEQQLEGSLDVSESAVLSDLEVVLKIEHSHIGDLVVQLIPPGATQRRVNLHLREGGGQRNLDRIYRASMHTGLNKLLGTNCQGIWTLHVEDQAIRDTGVIELFGLNLTLSEVKPAAADQPTAERQAGRRADDRSVPEKKKKTNKQKSKQKRAKKKGAKRRQRKSN